MAAATPLQLDPNILATGRPPSGPSKEDIRRKYNLDTVYRMSFNESPLGPSPAVVKEIQRVAGLLGDYPPFSDESLRQALSQAIGRSLAPEHFYTGCSGFEALELVARGFLRAGHEVIVSHPTFGVYNRVSEMLGATIVDVPLGSDDFRVDIDGILAAVNDKTRMVIMCNPNNPTGTIMPAADMDRLVNEMPDHVVIVTDEVYHHFVTSPDFPDSIQYVLAGKPVVIIHTFSKAYGLAGLRLGYGITTPELADYLSRLQRGFHQNQLALAAGIAALNDQAHLKKNVDIVLKGKQWLYEQFDRLDLKYWPSETNFLVVQTPLPDQLVVDQLVPFGVLVRPLGRAGFTNCLRVTVSVPEGNQAFITGLETILANKDHYS